MGTLYYSATLGFLFAFGSLLIAISMVHIRRMDASSVSNDMEGWEDTEADRNRFFEELEAQETYD